MRDGATRWKIGISHCAMVIPIELKTNTLPPFHFKLAAVTILLSEISGGLGISVISGISVAIFYITFRMLGPTIRGNRRQKTFDYKGILTLDIVPLLLVVYTFDHLSVEWQAPLIPHNDEDWLPQLAAPDEEDRNTAAQAIKECFHMADNIFMQEEEVGA
ncbi:hypothetical protein DFH08DRAFT_802040 [Mycena albidolilacea]|uniref:Uncharacterized protein n=1 Tax=Mycena albidolilacea TaxID=1033008 RepID=A0AAD7EYR4_9AGAR|nr:hypothetical protein DFH08DRAFT_803265 [Mycena albidolilacea]KAJ7358197.1 hypothetical protein DFH08DRAFT_802040 [Mycena albidolilacea]